MASLSDISPTPPESLFEECVQEGYREDTIDRKDTMDRKDTGIMQELYRKGTGYRLQAPGPWVVDPPRGWDHRHQ